MFVTLQPCEKSALCNGLRSFLPFGEATSKGTTSSHFVVIPPQAGGKKGVKYLILQ